MKMDKFNLENFNPSGVVRRIDDLGRIAIPKDYRQKAELEAGTPFEIFYEKGTNRVLLVPFQENVTIMCKYYAEFEGICVNADSPYCADFCPCEEHQEICKYMENRSDNE